MLRMFDWRCGYCGKIFESLQKSDMEIITCPKCKGDCLKIFPLKSPTFSLTYNPKKDMVDWDGNRSRYYDEYKAAKSRGERVNLPE